MVHPQAEVPPDRRVVPCGACRLLALDHRMETVGSGHIEVAARFQRDYCLGERVPKNAPAARYRLREVWNHTCVDILSRAFPSTKTVLDFGAGGGAFLDWAASNACIESYVGYEPNPHYFAVAKEVEAPFPVVLHQASSYDRAPYEAKADVAIALMTLSHVPPDHARRLIEAWGTNTSEIVIQDFLANEGADENAIFHVNPGFPLFAHPYKHWLASNGFMIVETQPTRPLYQAFSWGVLRAQRC